MDKGCYGPYPPAAIGVVINLHLLQDFRRFEAHFLDAIFAAPRVSTLWSSLALFQDFAIRFAARVLFPGTGWVALFLLIDLTGLKVSFSGKMQLPMGFIDFLAFHAISTAEEATISFKLRRPHFWRTVSDEIMSLRLVLVIVRATELIAWFLKLHVD